MSACGCKKKPSPIQPISRPLVKARRTFPEKSDYYVDLCSIYGCELLMKADKDDEWVVYLQASNDRLDFEDDSIIKEALEKEKEYFLEHGVISWDHAHRTQLNPEFIVGEPLDVKFTGDTTWTKIRLYPDNEHARHLQKLARSKSSRIKGSVGGRILDWKYGAKEGKTARIITKVRWNELALTHKPANGTLMAMSMDPGDTPFSEFKKSFSMYRADGIALSKKLEREGMGYVEKGTTSKLCHNCAFYEGGEHECELFDAMSKTLPSLFDLDPQVEAEGYCNYHHDIEEGRNTHDYFKDVLSKAMFNIGFNTHGEMEEAHNRLRGSGWNILGRTGSEIKMGKALMAGANTDSAGKTGGGALVPESMDAKKRRNVLYATLSKMNAGLIKTPGELKKHMESVGLPLDALEREIENGIYPQSGGMNR